MIVVIADTSALVSLEIKHVIKKASRFIRFVIPDAVHTELKDIAVFNDVHGVSARSVLKLIGDSKISIKLVEVKNEYLKNIDLGEAEVLSLADVLDWDYIITDDVKALPYMTAFVIRLLYNTGTLSRRIFSSSCKWNSIYWFW
ncbi:MAG: hypothetical protein ACE5KT_09355 [Methanosarcinales archaeon]